MCVRARVHVFRRKWRRHLILMSQGCNLELRTPRIFVYVLLFRAAAAVIDRIKTLVRCTAFSCQFELFNFFFFSQAHYGAA